MRTQLEQQILALPIPERIKLVEDIWDSIALVPEAIKLTDEQMDEIERRLEDYRANPEDVIPWEEIKNRLRLRA
jgi:putative addiction module component (TIGR02574 family)